MYSNLEGLLISPDKSVKEAIAFIGQGGKQILLVVDEELRLIGTVTDGDIRRAILADMALDASTVGELLENRICSPRPVPVVAPIGSTRSEIMAIMHKEDVNHIPLLDHEGRVGDLVTLQDLVKDSEPLLQAVIMAGGYGHRLRPLTRDTPKPMLPMGDKPLLERTIDQLSLAGIRQVYVSTHFKKETIQKHFGDGSTRGLHIQYIDEEQPMGTAGAVSALEESARPLLVMNGDILTNVDFKAMLNFHKEHMADMTIAVKQHEIQVPYGVMECNGVEVTGISEKPLIRHFINAGIYLLNPNVCRLIPKRQAYDMPDLIRSILEARYYRVVSFPVREYWQDIGHIEDYKRALADIENGAV